MSDEELDEFKLRLARLKGAFANPFWSSAGRDISALADMVDSFNDRLVALERQPDEEWKRWMAEQQSSSHSRKQAKEAER